MQSDTLSITLRFGSWTMPMTIQRQEEEIYRQAEKLIKERYSYYTNCYPDQKTEMYLVMTILDVAVRLKRTELSVDMRPVTDRLSLMLSEIDSALESE